MSFLGEKIFDGLKDAPTEVWIGLGAATVVVITVWWMRGRKKASVARTAKETET